MTAITELSDLTGDYVFDTAETRIGFVARHTMATRVRGHLDKFEGDLHLDGDDPSKSNAQVVLQAESIQTGNPRRDAAVRERFLDSGAYPTISFTSTGVQPVDQSNFRIAGELTIRGVTRPVTANVRLTGAENDRWGNVRVGFAGSATIDRKDWGVHWNAAIGLVSRTVVVEFEIAAVRQS